MILSMSLNVDTTCRMSSILVHITYVTISSARWSVSPYAVCCRTDLPNAYKRLAASKGLGIKDGFIWGLIGLLSKAFVFWSAQGLSKPHFYNILTKNLNLILLFFSPHVSTSLDIFFFIEYFIHAKHGIYKRQ